MFFLQGKQLIYRIEFLILDAGAGILFTEAEDSLLFQFFADAVGSFITVGNRIRDALSLFIQQHKVHCPCINTEGYWSVSKPCAFRNAFFDMFQKTFNIPAQVSVLLDQPVFKAVDLFQLQNAVFKISEDMSAG